MDLTKVLADHAQWLAGAAVGGQANLRDADLSGATLSGAALSAADLRGADLRGARLRGTVVMLVSDYLIVVTATRIGIGCTWRTVAEWETVTAAEAAKLSGRKEDGPLWEVWQPILLAMAATLSNP